MNYYSPSQRVSSLKWDYTCNNRPTGYCRKYEEFSPEFIEQYHISETEQKKHQDNKHKYHDHGHETADEARNCYKQYQLDHELRFGKMSNQQLRCKICQEWTQHFAEIGCSLITLCEKHNNRETVEEFYEAPSQCWSS